MKLIESLKQRWADYQHQRFLKKMGWSEAAFRRRSDPRVFYGAQTVDGFYLGYSYKHIYNDSRSRPFFNRDWVEVYREMNDWCRENLTGHWREDIHRVYEQTGIGVDGELVPDLWLSDLGNYDVLVYAFENERDCFMFTLKWS